MARGGGEVRRGEEGEDKEKREGERKREILQYPECAALLHADGERNKRKDRVMAEYKPDYMVSERTCR